MQEENINIILPEECSEETTEDESETIVVQPPLEKRGRFRCRSKKIFLTFISTAVNLEEVPLKVMLNLIMQRIISLTGSESIVQFIRICKEEAPNTHSIHFHCLLLLKDALVCCKNSFDFFIHGEKIHPKIETCKTVKGAKEYLAKGGEFIDYGNLPENIKLTPVERTALKRSERNKLLIDENIPLTDLIEDGTLNVLELKKAIDVRILFKKMKKEKKRNSIRLCHWKDDSAAWKKNWKPAVFWLYGNTGTGKTSACFRLINECHIDANEELWLSSATGLKWFDGYESQAIGVLDDLRRGDLIGWKQILRITDRYPCTVEIKGSHVAWCPFVIIITAPVIPEEMFTYSKKNVDDNEKEIWDSIDQLLRRIDMVIEFTGIDEDHPHGCDEEEYQNMKTKILCQMIVTCELDKEDEKEN